jgi:hypothetical protein
LLGLGCPKQAFAKIATPRIAFCWAHRTGEWRYHDVKAIKIKNHQRLAKSIFRYGLDVIQDKLLNELGVIKTLFEKLLYNYDFKSFSLVN